MSNAEPFMSNLGRVLWWVVILVICVTAISVYVCYTIFYSIPDRSLLAGAPFAERGWQGIIPGETGKEEALDLLKSSQYARRASIWVSSGTSGQERIYWDNKRLSFLGTSGLENMIILTDNSVAAIWLKLDETITVEQAIAHFGAPKMVARHETRNSQGGIYIAAYLLYPDQGLALHSVAMLSGELSPESPVTRVYYFESMSIDEFSSTVGPRLYMDLSQLEKLEWLRLVR